MKKPCQESLLFQADKVSIIYMTIIEIMKSKSNSKVYVWMISLSFIIYLLSFSVACSDVLDTTSELVEFQEDNTLNHPTDSVYSVMGIVNCLQTIADRTVLLGEARSDLMTTTDNASADLKRLAAFDLSQPNAYNQVADYYAVINNCNYFLAHADTAMERRGRKLFRYEYAAVKMFRAWTYLELVKNYGQVPLVTEPLMTEREASAAAAGPRVGIKELCEYFIDDLTPYAEVEHPVYGDIGGYPSARFFIPGKALLGDLCLWAGRYEEAARWYNSYLNDRHDPVLPTANRSMWTSVAVFQNPSTAYSTTADVLSFIPMEKRIFDGTISQLPNVLNSTTENNYYYQLTPSQGMRRLSADQIYCMEYRTETQTDTVYVPRSGFSDELMVGDLRLYTNYQLRPMGGQDEYSEYNSQYQTIRKVQSDRVPTYRGRMVYLRYAEALCRAGYTQSAMAVLKCGLCEENNRQYIDSLERVDAADLINFDQQVFQKDIVIGIHSLGSGDSECNAFYTLPQPPTALPTRRDTVEYQIPLVEDLIVNEMALEGAFEGYRFYDLMRVALRRGDAAYLADAVSRRNGQTDEQLRSLLMDTKNWYLPLP